MASSIDYYYVTPVFPGGIRRNDLDRAHELLIQSIECYGQLPKMKQLIRNEEGQLYIPEDAFDNHVIKFLDRRLVYED